MNKRLRSDGQAVAPIVWKGEAHGKKEKIKNRAAILQNAGWNSYFSASWAEVGTVIR